MKHITRSILALTILLASAFASHAQNVDEIVAKHIAAIGGADVWKNLKSYRMEGGMKIQGMDITVVVNAIHMKGSRQDITMMGMSGYSFTTDKEGWTYMPFGGQTAPEAMTPQMVKEGKNKLDLQGDFIDYKNKGTKVEFVGKDEVEGTEVFKLKVTHKDSTEKTVFIDANSYYLIRETDKIKADGKEMEASVDFSNFQKQPNGLVFPMALGTPQGEVTITKFEQNAKVDESLFKTPSK
jgi:outer membrane lipoprotein-sorting protein